MASVRLQKVLAHAGVSSRRAAEELMAAGRVRVDGRIVTELGTKVDPRGTRIEVDGQRVVRQSSVYLILHKPRGVVSTMSDPEGRSTVHDLLGDVSAARVYPVGRLDFNTSGALLVTNDGDFSVALMHPRLAVPKTYVVKVQGLMQDADVDRWRRGVELTDGKTLPAKVKLLRHEVDKTWLELTITEGRNQQVRRMGDAIGFRVMRLARISFAGVSTESLPPGRWRYLTADELATLKKDYGVPKRIVSPPPEGAAASAGARPRPGPAPKRSHARPTEPGSRGASSRSGPSRSKPTDWDPSRESPRSRSSRESPRSGSSRESPRSRSSRESPRSGASRSSRPSRESPGSSRESPRSRSSKESPRSGGSRSSGPSRESPRAGASRTTHESRESGARYGGGAPGRRGPEVREDWGGGVRRGGDRGHSGGDRGHQGGQDDQGPPRGDVGGRGGRTRTTGSGGGIGAGAGSYRVKGRHG
jgi:23S rRNA pseudouridine2605 synthase